MHTFDIAFDFVTKISEEFYLLTYLIKKCCFVLPSFEKLIDCLNIYSNSSKSRSSISLKALFIKSIANLGVWGGSTISPFPAICKLP